MSRTQQPIQRHRHCYNQYPSIGTGQFMRNQANGVELLGKKSHDDTGKASDDRIPGNSRQARISASLMPAHSHIRSDRTVVC